MTIRTRLALWYSGLLMLVIIIFGVAVITVSRVTLLQTVDQILIEKVDDILLNIDPLPVGEFEPADDVEIFFRSEDFFSAPGFSVQIWRTYDSGELDAPILERSSSDIRDLLLPLDPTYMSTDSQIINSTVIDQIPQRVLTTPFYGRNDNIIGVVQVSTPLNAVADANDQVLVITVVSAIICILISIALGMGVSRHLLKPIENIKEAANSIADTDDLETRLIWDGPDDELGQLTNVFNHMMARLENLFKIQQQFIGDISHELRTPLTSIIGHMELMDRYGVDDESMDAIKREADRMSRMVNDLLLLTRADAGEMKIDLYPVDLDVVTLEVYEQALKLAKERQLKIELARVEPVRLMHGNTDRLRQLLLNLINNAIKFTPDGGTIKLFIYPEDDNAILEIHDTGIGISENDLKRIFDRFFQADLARVHRSESDGAGLGLSIARWIVDSHGGDIKVSSTLGDGTVFRISLPVDAKIA